MHLAVKRPSIGLKIAASSSVERNIRDFIAGRSDGEELLHALFDYVLDEPVPERLRVLLRR